MLEVTFILHYIHQSVHDVNIISIIDIISVVSMIIACRTYGLHIMHRLIHTAMLTLT